MIPAPDAPLTWTQIGWLAAILGFVFAVVVGLTPPAEPSWLWSTASPTKTAPRISADGSAPVPCAMSPAYEAIRRIHVMDSSVPGPGYALTIVFVHGQPVMHYQWTADGVFISGTILANMWTLHTETDAEAFIEKVRQRSLVAHPASESVGP